MSQSQPQNSSPITVTVERLSESWKFAPETTLQPLSVQVDGKIRENLTAPLCGDDLPISEAQRILVLTDALRKHDDPVQLLTSTGWGNVRSPLGISKEAFSEILTWLDLSPDLLRKIPVFNRDVPHFFEYGFEQKSSDGSSETGTEERSLSATLHLAFKIDLRQRAYVMCLCRYNMNMQRMRGLLFECERPSEINSKDLFPNLIVCDELLREELPSLGNGPAEFFSAILRICESRIRGDFYLICRELLESQGQAPRKRQRLFSRISRVFGSKDNEYIHARLFDRQFEVAKSYSRCEMLHRFGTELQTILQRLSPQSMQVHGVIKDISDTMRRVDVDMVELNFAQKRLQSQVSALHVLSSRADSQSSYQVAVANRKDSAAMRTMSVLTMVFLPATFVSTMFSTTIFNFQDWGNPVLERDSLSTSTLHRPGVVSRAWWIYLLACLFLTLTINTIWYCWNRRASRKWESPDDPDDLEASPKLELEYENDLPQEECDRGLSIVSRFSKAGRGFLSAFVLSRFNQQVEAQPTSSV